MIHAWHALALWLMLFSDTLAAHEIRPAYLEITQTASQSFDIVWKQPSNGSLALHLVPKISNIALDRQAVKQTSSNSFLVKRWENIALDKDSFEGAEIYLEGLENSITDALLNISFLNGQQIQTILKPDNPRLRIQLIGTGKLPVLAYARLGIEHILSGYDHLSFVFGLLLLINQRWKLLQTITAFTLAHSITLAMAALAYIDVQASIIEALVALSIIFVAIEIIRFYRGYVGLTVHYPWLIAFVFGLLHGFAFAGSLAETGLPAHNIPGALLLFNLGVEIGQLLFVAVMLWIRQLLKTLKPLLPLWCKWLPPYAIGSFASFWMIERLHLILHA